MEMMGDILERTIAYTRSALCASQDERNQLLAEHRRIVNAIRNRDPDAAEHAMTRHLQHVVASYDRVDGDPEATDAPAPPASRAAEAAE